MSYSQIKQIAGRAGRFGLHADGSEGSVTTLEAKDIKPLRQVLEAPITPAHQAYISPEPEDLMAIAELLPRTYDLAKLFAIYEDVTQLPTTCLPSPSDKTTSSSAFVVPFAHQLAIKEAYMFNFVPVNKRDAQTVRLFTQYLHSYVKEGAVSIVELMKPDPCLAALEQVEALRPDIEAMGRSNPEEHRMLLGKIKQHLSMLESLHKSCVAYIWIHFRIPLNFPEITEATEYKTRAEEALHFCLRHLTHVKQSFKSSKAGRRQHHQENAPSSQQGRVEWVSRVQDKVKVNQIPLTAVPDDY